MKLPTRRAALLLCTLALNAFFFFSPPATATLGARRCQQECDAEKGACDQSCNESFDMYSDAWQSCRQQCQHDWQSCSGSAITCSPGVGTGDDCYTCTAFGHIECADFGMGYMCYPVFDSVSCDLFPGPSMFCF